MFVDCQQCDVQTEYPGLYGDWHSPWSGDSYFYDKAATYVVGLYQICRASVGVPSGAKNITEPPL